MAYTLRDCLCRYCAPRGSRHRANVKANTRRMRRLQGATDISTWLDAMRADPHGDPPTTIDLARWDQEDQEREIRIHAAMVRTFSRV